MPSPPCRKSRAKPPPYARQPKAPTQKNAPKTSAKPTVSKKRDNLMLHDWMTVFAYIDAHTSMSQTQIRDHFASNKDTLLAEVTRASHISKEGPDRMHYEIIYCMM
ncbi:hypothetical protein H0H87_009471 [Tephrocybe sp. NHM501043]|nr:hypothetical protein H0H87_012566 [Tephrocybe sp. NHM501043]KAG6852686.1 hypothetical protein H0H87_009490 [Tephrocybe sp. NHM501043]KAG6852699.1 hypothetical protein H0H87_009471 [Tephrocybe sp. NHM501043]